MRNEAARSEALRIAAKPLPQIMAFEEGQSKAHALAETANDDSARLDLARSLGHRTVTAWWRARFRGHASWLAQRETPCPFGLTALPDGAAALAEGIGTGLSRAQPEIAAYRIGLIYMGMLPRAYRAKNGIYYTPSVLTERLIDLATSAGTDWTKCRVLDPACGGGAFLAPLARRMVRALPDCSPAILLKNIGTRLRGYEIDPFGALLAQAALDAVLAPFAERAEQNLPEVVAVCDSLRNPLPLRKFDLVIGNPPYGRVRLEPEMRRHFRRSLYGHANLYGLFTDMAVRHARPGGVIAYVTPTSFLTGRYFKNLRSLLGEEAPPAKLDFVTARKGVFADVLQETVLSAYRRGGALAPVSVQEVELDSDDRITVRNAGDHSLPDSPSSPWILPRCAAQASIAGALSRLRHRLKDWGYSVSTGPLVWNRHRPQLRDRPGRDCYPLIWAEAVTSEGQFVWRAEKRNHTRYFEVGEGDGWLKTTEPCVLLQRTTAKEQSRRLIAAALPGKFIAAHGGVVVENHLNMLRPSGTGSSVAPSILTAFLNSAAADQAFRCLNGSVAVSAYELEALPLPDPRNLQNLARLSRGGAIRRQMEAECARLLR